MHLNVVKARKPQKEEEEEEPQHRLQERAVPGLGPRSSTVDILVITTVERIKYASLRRTSLWVS